MVIIAAGVDLSKKVQIQALGASSLVCQKWYHNGIQLTAQDAMQRLHDLPGFSSDLSLEAMLALVRNQFSPNNQ